MIATQHDCVINALNITELQVVNDAASGLRIEAKYLLGVAEIEESAEGPPVPKLIGIHGTGRTHPTYQWSEDTINNLRELLRSMERDLLPRHFRTPAGLETEHGRLGSGEEQEVDQV